MTSSFFVRIAEHRLVLTTGSDFVKTFICDKYGASLIESPAQPEADLVATINDGYGTPFENYDVSVSKSAESIVYERADYRIEADQGYRFACIDVHDDFALKHAMVNLYSAYITQKEWGLLLHSSCLLEKGRAYLFAGHSGAGKSTVVQLSQPRPILSDEATIIKIEGDDVVIYNSPFRSDTELPHIPGTYALKAIQILRQSMDIRRHRMGGMEGLQQVFKRVFYWAHDPEETKKVFRMCKALAERVPVYELYFQKNDKFWEEIS